MRPRPPLRLAAVALGACLLALGACRDDAPAPPGPAAPAAADGEPAAQPPKPEDVEAAKLRLEAHRADMDRQARARMEAFQGLVYDPARDAGVRAAAGGIEVEVDGVRATYLFAFDASKPLDAQVEVSALREDAGLHAGAAAQARRFAVLAVRGAYSQVLSYTPPVQWQLAIAQDGATIVVAPPFKSATGVSYRLDAAGLVVLSGATDGTTAVRTAWRWGPFGGKSLLTAQVEDDGRAMIDYEYATDTGVALLRRAVLLEGVHRYTAQFTWTRVDRT